MNKFNTLLKLELKANSLLASIRSAFKGGDKAARRMLWAYFAVLIVLIIFLFTYIFLADAVMRCIANQRFFIYLIVESAFFSCLRFRLVIHLQQAENGDCKRQKKHQVGKDEENGAVVRIFAHDSPFPDRLLNRAAGRSAA